MQNVNGHIPIDLLYNLILFILYSSHSISSLPPPFASSEAFLVHLSSANIFALLSFLYRQTDRQIHRQTDTHTNTKIHTYKHKNTQTDRQTDIHTYKYTHTHRRTYKNTHAYTCKHAHSSVEPYRSYFHYICNNFLLISFSSP